MAQADNQSINSRLNEILRRKNLSATDSRRKILTLFLSTPDAMAHGHIEKKAGEKFDRVTIYRTLQTFVEKGIIHTIPTADNSVLYALCKDCAEGHHHDDHVHFVCSVCDRTICLDDVISPKIDLPEGYKADSVQVVLHGTCKDCNKK
jgi:Fur family transcriptional regulator, ferric uptake regulator